MYYQNLIVIHESSKKLLTIKSVKKKIVTPIVLKVVLLICKCSISKYWEKKSSGEASDIGRIPGKY